MILSGFMNASLSWLMKVGDLVQTISGVEHSGRVGIITHILEPQDHNLWPKHKLVEVMYSQDEILTWSDRALEMAS